MRKILFVAAFAAIALAPHSVLAQTSAAPAPQQACVTPHDSDEALYEVLGMSHPKSVTRQCFPDGKLQLWTLSSDDNVHVIEHDQTGKLVRDVVVWHDVYLAGWQMVVHTVNAKGEFIEQNWVNQTAAGKALPKGWTLFNVNVYQGKKDTDHPLAVIMFSPNKQPIVVREARPDGNNDLQRYSSNGSLEYSIIVDGSGKKVSDNNGHKDGPFDPSWTTMPKISDLPALK